MITWEKLDIEEKIDGTLVIEQNGVRRNLEIEPDYYSASYCTFIQYYRLKYQVTIDQKVIYMVNVIMIYCLQCILLFCVFYFVKRKQLEENSGYMTMMHVDVLLTRFICGWLMHMASEPEVRQAMAMFKYVLQHTRQRGQIINLTRRVLDKVIFIEEKGKKPVEYDWVYLKDDAEFNRYRREGERFAKFARENHTELHTAVMGELKFET